MVAVNACRPGDYSKPPVHLFRLTLLRNFLFFHRLEVLPSGVSTIRELSYHRGLSTLYQLSSCREFAWTYFKLLIGEGRWDSAKCQTSARCQCTLHHHYHINDQSQSTIIDRFPGNFVRNPRTPGKMNYWKPGRNLGQIIIYWQLT